MTEDDWKHYELGERGAEEDEAIYQEWLAGDEAKGDEVLVGKEFQSKNLKLSGNEV